MEEIKALDSIDRGVFGAQAVMLDPQPLENKVEQPRLRVCRDNGTRRRIIHIASLRHYELKGGLSYYTATDQNYMALLPSKSLGDDGVMRKWPSMKSAAIR